MRYSWIFVILASLLALSWGCSPPESDGDGDADTDVDADSDADGDSGACPADWDCCEDSECSNGVYCDGLEVCDRGECQPGVRIDCADEFECTVDTCDEASNRCVHEADHSECIDDTQCNGDERCDPTDADADDLGCIPGSPKVCDDGDDCTDDFCDSTTDDCAVRIRDSDDDGYGDERCSICDPDDPTDCEVGDDCDDSRDDVYPGAPEVCDDSVDNDCDRAIDLTDDDCVPENDTCADATVLPGPGTYTGATRGLADDYDTSCSGAADIDAVFQFELADASDVEVRVTGGTNAVALLSSCAPVTEVTCGSGGFHQFGLAAGTYFIVVDTAAGENLRITLEIDPATDPPANDTCAGAIDITAATPPVAGDAYGANDDTDAFCAAGSDRDVYYTMTLTDAADLTVAATAVGAASDPYVEVRSGCDPATAIECGGGTVTAYNLAAGTYTIVVESSGLGSPFELTTTLASPTAGVVHAGPHRSCADPLVVDGDATVIVNNEGAGDDHTISCAYGTNEDVVFQVNLATARDLVVDVREGPSSYIYMDCAVTTTCAATPDEEICGDSYPLRAYGLAAGTYYVICDASSVGAYTVEVRTTDPMATYDVTGNDTCATPHVMAGTGIYRGDTTAFAADYLASCGSDAEGPDAVYQLDLAADGRVLLDLSGSTFDTVLHVHSGDCATGPEVTGGCNDDGGTSLTSLLDLTLTAGTYYVIVDGYGTTSSGTYQLLAEIL